eukprot:6406957-Amphidinium_carterae.2
MNRTKNSEEATTPLILWTMPNTPRGSNSWRAAQQAIPKHWKMAREEGSTQNTFEIVVVCGLDRHCPLQLHREKHSQTH